MALGDESPSEPVAASELKRPMHDRTAIGVVCAAAAEVEHRVRRDGENAAAVEHAPNVRVEGIPCRAGCGRGESRRKSSRQSDKRKKAIHESSS
jgi:hypothetical protein